MAEQVEQKNEKVPDVWELDVSRRLDRLTWWWWFWVFFVKEKEDRPPRQLMVLWSAKNCRKIQVGEHWWKGDTSMTRREDGSLMFNGMAASWFFDGSRMHEPFTLVEDVFVVDGGSLVQSRGDDHLFCSREGEDHMVVVDGGRVKFQVHISREEEDLPGLEMEFKEHFWTRRMGYEILKTLRAPFEGSIVTRGDGGDERTEEIEGTAYFQRVTVHAPAVPWYWGIVHFDDGSYLQYYMPHLGLPMLRRSKRQWHPLNRGVIPLVRTMDFHHAPTGTEWSARDTRIKVSRGNDDLPLFHVEASNSQGTLSLELEAYSRATWSFRQPILWLLSTRLHYNEYPVVVRDMRLTTREGEISLNDLGRGVGNSEMSWGTLF